MRMAVCHPNKKHKANGMCQSCWTTTYYATRKDQKKATDFAGCKKLKLAAFNAYGGPHCACCGETLPAGLTIDHVKGNGNTMRKEQGYGYAFYRWLKRNNYPPGYQVLCATCNMAKGTGDHCPHRDISSTPPKEGNDNA